MSIEQALEQLCRDIKWLKSEVISLKQARGQKTPEVQVVVEPRLTPLTADDLWSAVTEYLTHPENYESAPVSSYTLDGPPFTKGVRLDVTELGRQLGVSVKEIRQVLKWILNTPIYTCRYITIYPPKLPKHLQELINAA